MIQFELLNEISKYINIDKNKLKNNPLTVMNDTPIRPINLPVIRVIILVIKDKNIINKYI